MNIFRYIFLLFASLNAMGQISDTTLVYINQTPSAPTLTTTASAILNGQSATLTASGCSTGVITWNTGATGSTLTVSPTATTTYDAFCTSNKGCIGAKSTSTITVSALPNPTASPATICSGQSSTLTASGCTGTYTWNTGTTGTTLTVSPTTTTVYSVTCTNTSGTSSPASVTVNVNQTPSAPTLTTNSNSILAGQSATLTASGCSTGVITWNTGATGSTLTVSPTATTTYNAFCTSAQGCAGAKSNIVIEVYTQTPTIVADKTEVCSGEPVKITAYSCNGTYHWSTGATDPSITVNPTSTTTYSVYCSSTAGNSPLVTAKVIVYGYENKPTVNDITIISGNYGTLTASGCSSYLWNTGATDPSISVNPTSTTSYKVKCNGFCPSGDVEAKVNVISPNVNVTASPATICNGQSSTLTASGCTGTYKWNTGEIGESIKVFPKQTTQYSVICSTSAGDGSPAFVTVTVFPLPSKPVMFGDTLITSGKTSTLKAVCSSSSVTWNTGATTETITVKPSTTTWYKAFCTSAQGCVGASDSIRVKVSTPPIEIVPEDKVVKLINKRKTIEICEGEKPKLNLIGCEPSSKVVWNTGETTRSIFVSPIKNTSYWASCTDIVGTKYDSLDVVVFPKTKLVVSTKDTIKTLIGKEVALKVNNCNGKVTWISPNGKYNQITSDSIKVIVTEKETTFKAFCTNNLGCNSDTVTFIIIALPQKPLIETPSKVCEGSTIELKGSCPTNTTLVWERYSNGKIIESSKGDSYNFKFKSLDKYVAYCQLKDGSKGDTTSINLKVTTISFDNVIMYPNPTYDVLKMTSNGCLNGVNIKVWDISGRLLYAGLGNEEKEIKELSLEDLPSGEYIIQLISEETRKNISKMILKANKNEK